MENKGVEPTLERLECDREISVRSKQQIVGVWSRRTGQFLIVLSALTILLGGPLLLKPLAWAQTLGWSLPKDTDLAIYFGRCLGIVVTSLGLMGFVAAHTPKVRSFYFNLVLTMIGANILVHGWGAIQNIQPVSETIEIAAWALLLFTGFVFYPVE